MITTIIAMIVMAMIVVFSLHMAGEIHDYMANDNFSEEITVFGQAFE